MIGLGISIPKIAVNSKGGSLVSLISSLFRNNEPGVWYDPSDMSTMFQDAAGTTPVTAVEQPVGLILDKSKGLVLGPELVVNGAFDTDTNGWTQVGGGSFTWDASGGIACTDVGGADCNAQTTITTVAGRWYRAQWTVRSATGGWLFRIRNAGDYNYQSIAPATGTYTAYFVGSITGSNTVNLLSSDTNQTVVFDNISVRELPGNHATQTTSTSRPVLSARYNLLTKTEQFDDAGWLAVSSKPTVGVNATTSPIGTTAADKLTPAAVTGTYGVAFNNSFPAGTYTYTVYAKNAGYNRIGIRTYDGTSYFQRGTVDLTTGTLVSDASQRGTWTIEDAGNGWWKIQVTGTAVGGFASPATEVLNTTLVQSSWTPNGVDGIYIWGASLVPANQADLPYQRVNTATDYDADPSKFKPYLRFDGVDDWLVTPTITPGTDKAQVFAGVRKLSDAAAGMLVELSFNALSNNGAFYFDAPEDLNNRYLSLGRGNAAGAANQAATVGALVGIAPDTAVMTVTHDIAGDLSTIRRNAVAGTSGVGDKGTGNFLAYPLYIGRRGGTTLPFNGHLYGLIVRFGANLPTETIANAEKYIAIKTGFSKPTIIGLPTIGL